MELLWVKLGLFGDCCTFFYQLDAILLGQQNTAGAVKMLKWLQRLVWLLLCLDFIDINLSAVFKAVCNQYYIFSGGQATVEASIEQQQYELIASLERSFQELLASNSALCCRFNRLEQLVLQHRSAFTRLEAERQPRSGSADPGSNVSRCVGFGSHQQAGTSRFNVDIAEMLPRSSTAQWRSENQPVMRMSQAERNVFHTDAGIMSDNDDASTSSAVHSQQDHWENIVGSSDVDPWPDTTSVNTRRQYTFL